MALACRKPARAPSAAEAELAIVAWRTVMATRQAVLHLTLADSARRLAAVELAATLEVATLERERFAESAVPASELYRTEAEVEVMRSAAAAAERDQIEARGSLAAALGVPPRSIDSIVVVTRRSAACERLDALGVDSLQAVALTARPEIARSLAEYAIAEAQVKLQVATTVSRSRPGTGVHLGSGSPSLDRGARPAGAPRVQEPCAHR